MKFLPQPLGVETAVQPGEQAQSWRFSMPRLKGSAVEGSFTLIEGKQGLARLYRFQRQVAPRGARYRLAHAAAGDVPRRYLDGRHGPVVLLQQDKLSGYTLVGNGVTPPAATS